ncbi:9966_t:CDS:1 [Cetraspora pellucida]|uniref:9966_t:CDS:1 n=1 Tax=Cetraspora pellucida TaxID=1433469 RepID=A0ACA9KPV4_9GLOM|nr:9966_t:CDS:1 [Cetraspora pellucida]
MRKYNVLCIGDHAKVHLINVEGLKTYGPSARTYRSNYVTCPNGWRLRRSDIIHTKESVFFQCVLMYSLYFFGIYGTLSSKSQRQDKGGKRPMPNILYEIQVYVAYVCVAISITPSLSVNKTTNNTRRFSTATTDKY